MSPGRRPERAALLMLLMLLMLLIAAPRAAEPPSESAPAAPPAADKKEDRRQYHTPSGANALAPLPSSLGLSATAMGGTSSVYETDEVLTLQTSEDEAQRADALMRVHGGRLLRRQNLKALGVIISTYRVAFGARLPQQLQQIVDGTPELLADLNHRYHLQAGSQTSLPADTPAVADDPRSQTYFARRIGWSPALADCAKDRAVGLLDTPIALNHPALRRARIRTFSALPAGVNEAPADHATAIASLLVGDPAVARHAGLIPQARLYAANVFRALDDGSETSAEWLALGLDWLVAQNVSVINLSLGGPENRVLARAVEETLARGIVIVAAAGNDGPGAPPQYPAAWPPVIAVTAVDANHVPYPDANRGDYIDFAAPGVDVWSATAAGAGRFHSGSSFAAPFVTAAVAALGQGAEARLTPTALDLGTPGPDAVFGRGLIRLGGGGCAGPSLPD